MSVKYKEDEVLIRPAMREDMADVADMIQELADFERMSKGPKLSVEDLERDCFDVQPGAFSCLVAEVELAGGAGGPWLAGYAIYYPSYSTWEGRALFLEDICVRREHRHRGVGSKLFTAVAKEAARAGSRLDFHVLEWNPARHFYEARGAVNLTRADRWCCYRLAGPALARLAGTSPAPRD